MKRARVKRLRPKRRGPRGERPTTRAERNEVLLDPEAFEGMPESDGAWYETGDDVDEMLEWGREKARLLRWVRRQMKRRLTVRERQCIHLHYFRGLPYREIGRRTNSDASSVCRAVRRSLRKLRRAAEIDADELRRIRRRI